MMNSWSSKTTASTSNNLIVTHFLGHGHGDGVVVRLNHVVKSGVTVTAAEDTEHGQVHHEDYDGDKLLQREHLEKNLNNKKLVFDLFCFKNNWKNEI